MSLAEVFIPPSLDAKQIVRLRRFGLGALIYFVSMALVKLVSLFGLLPAASALQAMAASIAINLALYAAFRSSFNLRFADPSLTMVQIVLGVTVLMFVVYHMDDGRSIALYGCFLIFLFGTFRLRAREFVLLTLYTLAAYALVIVLLTQWRPGAIHDLWLDWVSLLVLAGALPCFAVVGGQVNALRRALRESAEQLRLFTDNVPAMTVSYDENLRCRFINKRFAEYFGYTVEGARGKHLREIVGAEAYAEIEPHFRQVLQGHPVTYQRVRTLPNGEARHLEVKLLPHAGGQGRTLGCFCVTSDITEHKLAEQRMQHVAYHDNLTGLPNRLLFNDRLAQSIRFARRDNRKFALLFLDLDKFKQVNDTLGHDAGDELLQQVATRIRGELRESDTVARVGGDEFTVILPDVARREDAEIVAKKIVAALSAPLRLERQGRSVEIGTSIGVALFPSDAGDADALVDAADGAMYEAKQAGSGYRFCVVREPLPVAATAGPDGTPKHSR